MAKITHISIFTRDVERLPSFYAEVFGLAENSEARSRRFRELHDGAMRLGFPYIDAYKKLGLDDQADPSGLRAIITFTAGNAQAVDDLTAKAVACGARLVKPGFQTDFHQYLSVVLDPEGNAIRISAPALPKDAAPS